MAVAGALAFWPVRHLLPQQLSGWEDRQRRAGGTAAMGRGWKSAPGCVSMSEIDGRYVESIYVMGIRCEMQ